MVRCRFGHHAGAAVLAGGNHLQRRAKTHALVVRHHVGRHGALGAGRPQQHVAIDADLAGACIQDEEPGTTQRACLQVQAGRPGRRLDAQAANAEVAVVSADLAAGLGSERTRIDRYVAGNRQITVAGRALRIVLRVEQGFGDHDPALRRTRDAGGLDQQRRQQQSARQRRQVDAGRTQVAARERRRHSAQAQVGLAGGRRQQRRGG